MFCRFRLKLLNYNYQLKMQHFIEFWLLLFWFSFFLFILNNTNALSLLIFSELLWALLYMIFILLGLISDSISLVSFSFFILTFAAIEFSIGLFLILFLKNIYSTSLHLIESSNAQQPNLFHVKKLYFNFIKF